MKKTKIRKTNELAMGLEVVVIFLLDSLQTYMFSGARTYTLMSLLHLRLKIPKVNAAVISTGLSL